MKNTVKIYMESKKEPTKLGVLISFVSYFFISFEKNVKISVESENGATKLSVLV